MTPLAATSWKQTMAVGSCSSARSAATYLASMVPSDSTRAVVMPRDAAQVAVNAVIDPEATLDSPRLTVTGNVTLTEPEHAVSSTRDHLALRRDEQTRRERTSAELYELRRALKSPAIAQLWWASNNPEYLSMINTDPFKALVAATADAPERDINPSSTIEEVLLQFTSQFTGAGERAVLLQIFKQVLKRFDKQELLNALE